MTIIIRNSHNSPTICSRNSNGFKTYGENEVQVLGQHFFEDDVDRMAAEWGRFKYDLLDMQVKNYHELLNGES